MPRKPSTRSRPTPLSSLELEVMNVVWDLRECTSAQITSAYRKKRPLAPTTIRTVLTKLREKGYIEPIPTVGRGFLFRPLIAREEVARRSLRELVRSLFRNSPHQAIAYMLDDADISDSELEEIRGMIETSKRRQRKEK